MAEDLRAALDEVKAAFAQHKADTNERFRLNESSFNAAMAELTTVRRELLTTHSELDRVTALFDGVERRVEASDAFRGEAEDWFDEFDENNFRRLLGEPYSIELRPFGDGRGQIRNVDRNFHRFRPIREGAEAEKLYFTKGSWYYWIESGDSFLLREAELAEDYTSVTFGDTTTVNVIATLNRVANTISLSVSAADAVNSDERVIASVSSIEDVGSGQYATGQINRRQLSDIWEDYPTGGVVDIVQKWWDYDAQEYVADIPGYRAGMYWYLYEVVTSSGTTELRMREKCLPLADEGAP